jgi:Serine phosphatase RsbU, regulator of sigma subunit
MEVQRRLLPASAPKVRGLDVAGHSTYCDETGGDYFDFLVLDKAAPDQVLVALGDVMGHGVAAALVMAGVRAVLSRPGGCGGRPRRADGPVEQLHRRRPRRRPLHDDAPLGHRLEDRNDAVGQRRARSGDCL